MNRNEMFAAIIWITEGRCRLLRHNKSKWCAMHYYIYKTPKRSEPAEVIAYGWTLEEVWAAFKQWLEEHKKKKEFWWQRYIEKYKD